MNQGRIVETGDTESIYSDPQHPYTQRLLSAVPTLSGDLLDRFNRSST